VISGVFLWWLKGAERKLTAVALGLVIGGALGNVIDRIRFGAVADFLDFNGLWFPWVFNVADAAITVGAILLAADMIFLAETEPGKGTTWGQIKAWWRGVRSGSRGPGA
jgi:signal peptidase II